MKSLIKITSLALFTNLAIWLVPQRLLAQGVSVGFQVFYDDLSPYGSWVNNAEYGYVWYPNAGADFTPYGSNGYWAYTEAGWTWVSYYPWGWAPFHYGRWYFDPMYGNMWVPGNEWGPGWVTWRQSEGYYGWAPIGPGISLEMAYSTSYNVRNDQWRFVRNADFGRDHINNYYVDRSTNITIIQKSNVVNNTYVEGGRKVTYNAGPQRMEAEKRAGKTFVPAAIKESKIHGESMGKGELQLYRPQVQKGNAASKEAPRKLADVKDLKTPVEQKNKNRMEKQQSSEPVKKNESSKESTIQQKKPIQPVKQEPKQTQPRNVPNQQQPEKQQKPMQPNRDQPQPPNKQQPVRQQPQQNNNQQQKQAPVQHLEQQQQPPRNTNQPNRQGPPRQEKQQQQPQQQEQPRQQMQVPPTGNPSPKLDGERNHPQN